MTININVKTGSRNEMVDITSLVQKEISNTGVEDGICVVYVPHTTAGVTINEGADPAVCTDIVRKLNELVPPGSSVTVLVEKGRLVLGTWQKIFFCEFDGPRSRKVYVKI
jgi:thiamine phosphate synthase YjbQ (UPF0047 family)